ncbi:hypothetical protein [Chryseobacterium sp. A321]
MELILNELSLHDQFSSSENFRETGLTDILKFFQLQKNTCISILKKSDIYSRKIYAGKSLHTVMTNGVLSKSDEIRKLKSELSKIISDPFWDTSKKCDNDSKYIYNTTAVNDSALAECYERKSLLISFTPSNYCENILTIKKNTVSEKIANLTDSKELIKILYDRKIIDFEKFCKNYYDKSKLDFTQINQKKSFGLILQKKEEALFNSSFQMFIESEWSQILSQSRKGKGKTGFDFKKHHKQDYFAQYHPDAPIYKFRVNKKFRVFGFRIGDVFRILEFDLTHRLSD